MANVKIDILSLTDLKMVVELYNQIYKPSRDEAFFTRRFAGRLEPLIMVAVIDEQPVGFTIGFELKPGVFFAWLYGVLPQFTRQGIASQLSEAMHAWARDHHYHLIRMECHNQHRPMLHMAIKHLYDIVGIRWDSDRGDNLVIFEKVLD